MREVEANFGAVASFNKAVSPLKSCLSRQVTKYASLLFSYLLLLIKR